ncbi:hypothetical protein [Chromobacterium piscinae]|uniref:hypothetical protein n=1 Tax=Chromobacterium piscinae TaxID=686831 RepID=UPI00326164F0
MKLHYFYDPLCGWCYGASPLLQAAAALPGVSVEMHAGGMIDEEEGRAITPDWRAYVMPHDKRIAQMSSQPFGDAYYDGLLNDIGAPPPGWASRRWRCWPASSAHITRKVGASPSSRC